MRVRARLLLISLGAIALLSGCGSVVYHLRGHSAAQHSAPVMLALGERRLALETPPRLPAPGGFALGLASENSSIVSVETSDGARGASACTLVAHAAGSTVVHYVNRFTVSRATMPADELRAVSLGSFRVEVSAPAEPFRSESHR